MKLTQISAGLKDLTPAEPPPRRASNRSAKPGTRVTRNPSCFQGAGRRALRRGPPGNLTLPGDPSPAVHRPPHLAVLVPTFLRQSSTAWGTPLAEGPERRDDAHNFSGALNILRVNPARS